MTKGPISKLVCWENAKKIFELFCFYSLNLKCAQVTVLMD